jgi:glycosyltransferase involved in cell wall biosynthesis
MKISFIVPNYNYGDYIQDCVESIYNQTLECDYDVLIIDDASTDNSDEVINSLRRKYPIRAFFNDVNRGKNYCLNLGIREVTGRYTVILDSDDYLSPVYLRKCVEVMESGAVDNLGFVYTDSFLVDSSKNKIGNGYSTAFDTKLIYHKSYIPDCGLTLTKALKGIIPLSEEIKVGTKHHKWIKIIEDRWNGIHIKEQLFFYRMHDRNLSGIGNRVISDLSRERRQEFILSGYWPTQ